MKYLKEYKEFEGIENTMIGQIFTSKYDNILKKIFDEMVNDYNQSNLSDAKDGLGSIKYKLKNGDIITATDDSFFAIPGYTIKINDENIECSFLIAQKIYNFLKPKRDEKYKDSDRENERREKESYRKDQERKKELEIIKFNKLNSKYSK